ncbi:MAG: FAD synthetase family protein [Spirochaetaceae bacterium]|jgi:riboflavin kinase/FMN adenylyltransferase|nr:FAD synthetase family protein [Spirochaetaceae bacterium]
MQTIEWSQFLKDGLPLGGKQASMTIGVFDGVHRGHRVLIDRIVRHDDLSMPVIITFKRNHKKARRGQDYTGDISSFRQKSALIESLGVPLILIIDFSESFRRLPGLEFIRLLEEHGNMGFFAVGSDFRCGYHLDTDAQAIQRANALRGIPTDIAEALMEGPYPISSSRIRRAIAGGKLREAAAMLGCNYTADVFGVPSGGPDLSWDLASLGRVLPPPGRYPALLRGKNGSDGRSQSSLQAEVLIEGGTIRIPASFVQNGSGADWEYVEFLSI